MAKNKGVRIVVTLECTECRSSTEKRSQGVSRYTTEKNRRNTTERLEIKKFCPHDNKMTITKRSNDLLNLKFLFLSTLNHRNVQLLLQEASFADQAGDPIDYKDVDLLKKFITERGKILPRRLTGLTAKQQRDLTNAVKRARIVALLPFVNPEG